MEEGLYEAVRSARVTLPEGWHIVLKISSDAMPIVQLREPEMDSLVPYEGEAEQSLPIAARVYAAVTKARYCAAALGAGES